MKSSSSSIEQCSYPQCFFCTAKTSTAINQSPSSSSQAAIFKQLFKELPLRDKQDQILAITGLWSTAMAHPNSSEFIELGILECMTQLIAKGLRHRSNNSNSSWLSKGDNICIPYYAAHIIGSYTMNVEVFARRAVVAGAVEQLLELMRGKMTWVEQRVAVRALSHLASYESTFPNVAAEKVTLPLAMELARNALEIVYVSRHRNKQWSYHSDLLTRGTGSLEMETRKGEEWASQLQCWSLQLVNCFAFREEYLDTICKKDFLIELPSMWGGLVNGSSPAGVGLLRTICYKKQGRIVVASCDSVIDALCNVARSSDDWQYMAVDCLLWLLQDPLTRRMVFSKVAPTLADLCELRRFGQQEKSGDLIANVLLARHWEDSAMSPSVRTAMEDLVRLRRRTKIEKQMVIEDIRIKQAAALVLRLEGNARFSAGDIEGAVEKYTEALEYCPVRAKKDRITILNNRAQCHLMLEMPERAVSDTTRALCLCCGSRKGASASSSLWRRAQAYEMMGLAKESLLDAVVFANAEGCSSEESYWDSAAACGSSSKGSSSSCSSRNSNSKFVDDLVKRQMQRNWLFKDAARKYRGREQVEAEAVEEEEEDDEDDDNEGKGESNEGWKQVGGNEDDEDGDSEWETASDTSSSSSSS